MIDDQLQLFNISIVKGNHCAKMLPNGTPTIEVIRKSGRPRMFGVITIDCDGPDELENIACYLVARSGISRLLHEMLAAVPADAILLRRRIEAHIFALEGKYAGQGQAKPLAIDTWRRRNGLVPKFGHLTEAEIRSHVKIMDESQGRGYDKDEPFDDQLRRYVECLEADSAQWDETERTMMGSLLAELKAGYVLDRGMISDHTGSSDTRQPALANPALPAAPTERSTPFFDNAAAIDRLIDEGDGG